MVIKSAIKSQQLKNDQIIEQGYKGNHYERLGNKDDSETWKEPRVRRVIEKRSPFRRKERIYK